MPALMGARPPKRHLGYSIRITDPSLELPPPCGADLVPGALSDLRQGQTGNLGAGGGTVYFPVALVHETSKLNRLPVGAFRRGTSFAFRLRVKMIPLLPDANERQSIQDSSLAGYCVELNHTAAADLLHGRLGLIQ